MDGYHIIKDGTVQKEDRHPESECNLIREVVVINCGLWARMSVLGTGAKMLVNVVG